MDATRSPNPATGHIKAQNSFESSFNSNLLFQHDYQLQRSLRKSARKMS